MMKCVCPFLMCCEEGGGSESARLVDTITQWSALLKCHSLFWKKKKKKKSAFLFLFSHIKGARLKARRQPLMPQTLCNVCENENRKDRAVVREICVSAWL